MNADCLIKKSRLDGNLPIYKVQEIFEPECTLVHEDSRITQQPSRWGIFIQIIIPVERYPYKRTMQVIHRYGGRAHWNFLENVRYEPGQ